MSKEVALTATLQMLLLAFASIIITACVDFQNQSTRRGLRPGCVK